MTRDLIIMDLTDIEQKLFARLPRPPQDGSTKKPTVIWIVEWLPSSDQRTGEQLHKWIQEHCDFGSKCFVCNNKKEVITTIERATHFAGSGDIPLLHIEAHGDENGLEGPDGSGKLESLTWSELAVPLQQLNLHTRCNLVVFVAACTGFAGIKMFFEGLLAQPHAPPLAPAVALAGPVAPIVPNDLLWGTKEFYRRLRDNQPSLDEMVDSASLETGNIAFELEPFVVQAFDAFAMQLIISKRPEMQRLRLDEMRKKMAARTPYSTAEIELRLTNGYPFPLEKRKQLQQSVWNELFMINLFPNNQHRFGLDWSVIIDMVERSS